MTGFQDFKLIWHNSETLKSWFDEVISQICVLLYAQLKKLKGSYPKQKIVSTGDWPWDS